MSQKADKLESEYYNTRARLDEKYNETVTLKLRADNARERARVLYQDYFRRHETLKGELVCSVTSCGHSSN